MLLVKFYAPNTKGRDFVIGDLHGMYDLFMDGLKIIKFNKKIDRIFSVGDLIDRGEKSFECLKLIEEDWFHAVRANHEDMMLGSITGNAVNVIQSVMWMKNGGNWAINRWPTRDLIPMDLISKAANLPLVMVVNKTDGTRVNILHAEFSDGVSDNDIDNLSPKVLRNIGQIIWGRTRASAIERFKGYSPDKINRIHKMYDDFDKNLSTTIVGHSSMLAPTKLGKYIFIDTGAGFPDGKLTFYPL